MRCSTIQPLLSEYMDERLSARDTWEVDKHVSECNACARALNEMRATVRLMADTPRFEVSDDFLDRLNARLSTVEQKPPRRNWRADLGELFRPRFRPAWGAALAACALAGIVLTQLPQPSGVGPAPLPQKEPAVVAVANNQSVALAASNPLGDPAAAALLASSERDAEVGQ